MFLVLEYLPLSNYRALQAHADTLAFHAKEAAKCLRQADTYQDYA